MTKIGSLCVGYFYTCIKITDFTCDDFKTYIIITNVFI